ncbi:hypothetical protein G7A72_10625 [Flavobacterium sp. Sr18]|uniref:hypothetical protein n=1 Tax=Flavobacterium sp. Sr18 TaxID=935222 RepID=UPI0013E46035|nr:hypothetical protein [Flavobacterium sp. Sr18]QIH39235.1 hypothetical protein G7A72_10625 [Flavobacterium sp. Sr18]
MNISKEQNEAVNDIVELIASKLGNETRELNIVDAISTCARLAGSLLFRSFNFEIENAKLGSVVLSENANIKGPELINITHFVLQNFGITIDNQKMNGSSGEETKIEFLDAINLVQNQALEIMDKYKLSYEQLAHSTAIATAFIIQQSPNIPAETGFGKAIYHYIEGSKTYPPDFIKPTTIIETKNQLKEDERTNEIKSKENSDKPWWKIW